MSTFVYCAIALCVGYLIGKYRGYKRARRDYDSMNRVLRAFMTPAHSPTEDIRAKFEMECG
ncbi:hypothetical protein [Ralstonia phage RP13]|nr:hypothetical protein [Ralstonia phage RP13]